MLELWGLRRKVSWKAIRTELYSTNSDFLTLKVANKKYNIPRDLFYTFQCHEIDDTYDVEVNAWPDRIYLTLKDRKGKDVCVLFWRTRS